MVKYLLFVCLALSICGSLIADEGVNWVLLVAGSNEYYNYRHQADICHAYQIVHRYGIPDERIVVMMYDDIANNPQNPFKGQIINRPNGSDVYKGTVKDYIQKDVTPSMFLDVLQGKPTNKGSGKVIKSGPNDNVFVFFADHGAPGIIAFPNGQALHASQLNSAIKNMYVHKQYKNMVFYIEACESGSMFDGLLPENINVFATTAANPSESSYACYYDTKRNTYLGDLYSVNWMEDSDKENINTELLETQFQIVKRLTNLSHVMEYGNITMSKFFSVGQFQAESSSTHKPIEYENKIDPNIDAVKSEDVRMSILHRRLAAENDALNKEVILAEIDQVNSLKRIASGVLRQIVATAVKDQNLDLKELFTSKMKLRNHMCYVPSVDYLIEKCFSLKNEYVLRNLYMIVNLCESGVHSSTIKSAIDQVCKAKFSD